MLQEWKFTVTNCIELCFDISQQDDSDRTPSLTFWTLFVITAKSVFDSKVLEVLLDFLVVRQVYSAAGHL